MAFSVNGCERMKVKLTYITPCLGTKPGNPELLKTYIAGKAPDGKDVSDEVAERGVEDVIEDRTTGFDKEDGHPYIWDYMVKGFLKESWKALKATPGTDCSKEKAYLQAVDTLVFLAPEDRRIFFRNPEGDLLERSDITENSRSLRAQTMRGPRTGLAQSEQIEEGSTLTFTLMTLKPGLMNCLRECLDYGYLHGMLQWRNGGYGRFTWRELVD